MLSCISCVTSLPLVSAPYSCQPINAERMGSTPQCTNVYPMQRMIYGNPAITSHSLLIRNSSPPSGRPITGPNASLVLVAKSPSVGIYPGNLLQYHKYPPAQRQHPVIP